MDKTKESYNDQVEGRNSVLELLESGKEKKKIIKEKENKHG